MIIPFILEKVLTLYGNSEAVVCGGRRFSYLEFGERVFRLGRVFRTMGVKKGDRIAILHRNMHAFLEVYFAAAQIGAILVPLNHRLSDVELDLVLEDAGAGSLIAEDRFSPVVHTLKKMNKGGFQVVWTGKGGPPDSSGSLHYEDAIAAEAPDPFPPPDIKDDEIAHLYYTSGTTGRPKGVMLSHRNVCTHALAAMAELGIRDRDTWIHVAPLFHLADAWATFAVTWAGGRHVIVPEFDPLQVLAVMEKERVTITNMIPAMLNMLVHTPGVETFDFSSLRVLMSGGAPISPEIVRRLMDTFKCDYIQTYGMTETSPYLTVSILKADLLGLSPEEQFIYKAKTGRPFMAVLLKVVREDGTEVRPDGREVGEIIVKGDIVTQGYWNRPEETAGAIRDGWLYTGDMAVIDKEGYVDIVDRKKDMIITGGENVYSIEVENALYTHPAVLETAVVGVPDNKWGEAVKAFVVLKAGLFATEEDLIRHCRERIAGYKAPKSVEFISALPRTGSGKIYKKDLKNRL